MAKLMVLTLAALVLIAVAEAASFGECPLASKVQSCSPKCLTDRDCSQVGGKCCSNSCNYKSCVDPNRLSQSASSGQKYATGAGAYCGNVKCSSFEKCGLDSATKRQKCVRA